ncbi:hypothetical protein [Stutzerimonas stutzeri]|uniref:FimV/HubP-related protein n=1 Tax=Stutzerimonas stutzeri TaxID=316 RepID=UPI001C2E1784|nr:hypothetical protein [Stutzerimonas stutzeri]
MALGRRVLLTVASGSLFYSGMALALGMGDITLHSALNQPLAAEIDLLDAGKLSSDEIRVVLASSSDFAQAGIDRPVFLQDLSFTPVIDGDRSRIRVASSKPVREPYLNFLVEITQAKSRLLREYTVLLDPMPITPDTTGSVAGGVSAAVVSPVTTEPARFVPPAELPQASQGKRHRVASGESLWTIAGLYAGGTRASRAQFMRDIQALNPDAFFGGDAARLKANANLLLPDSAERTAPAAAEAVSDGVDAGQLQSAVESDAQPLSTPVLEPAVDELAALRRQFAEQLAASREENQQLKQLLIDMRLELNNVSAQLAEREHSQASASPQQEVPAPAEAQSGQPVVEPPASAASSFNWQDWTLPGGGALIALLLGGLWFSRRTKSEPSFPDAVMPKASPSAGTVPVTAAAPVEMPRQPAQASVSETDALEAADIYQSYGRRDEAIEVLVRGIERAPERLDYRLRHLGLLAESGDVDGYVASTAGYLETGGSQVQLDQLLALHPALAAAIAPVEPSAEHLFDPDVSFVLDEPLVALAVPSAPLAESAVEVPTTDSQPWLSDFDEDLLTIGELPSLLDDAQSFASMPSAEELRRLEPNPEHLVRLNQAVAYIKQGDMEAACAILDSLAIEGDEQQRRQVNELLARIA